MAREPLGITFEGPPEESLKNIKALVSNSQFIKLDIKSQLETIQIGVMSIAGNLQLATKDKSLVKLINESIKLLNPESNHNPNHKKLTELAIYQSICIKLISNIQTQIALLHDAQETTNELINRSDAPQDKKYLHTDILSLLTFLEYKRMKLTKEEEAYDLVLADIFSTQNPEEAHSSYIVGAETPLTSMPGSPSLTESL